MDSIVYGYGGSSIAAYQITRLIRRCTERFLVVAPSNCCSAMTMQALGADEIYTGPLSVFSPIDTSIANHRLAPKDASGNPVTVEIFQVKKYLEFVQSENYKEANDFRSTPHALLSEHYI